MTDPKTDYRCGFVALIGRPNAGKSTLMNQLLGGKLAITSSKPQTTRNRIAGIHTDDECQAILVDTPGIHDAWTELNKEMVDRAMSALDDVDLVCWLGDMTTMARRIEKGHRALGPEDEPIARAIEASGKPVIFVANKVDVVPHPLLLPVMGELSERFELAAIVPTSALTGDGVGALLAEIRKALPEGPQLYPAEEWTRVTERFLVSEVVREKIFHLTEQEVPYATTVEVVTFDESERDTGNRVHILCDVIVERSSQKGIVIGKKGEMLKRIGTLARKEIAELLGCRVHLELYVKVERDWTKSRKGLRKVGFSTT